jgi:acyl carrier protein
MHDVDVARAAIRGYILTNFLFSEDKNALKDGTDLIGEGIVDSTGILEVISFLEESFGIQVADEEMTPANFGTVAQIASLVQRKRAA